MGELLRWATILLLLIGAVVCAGASCCQVLAEAERDAACRGFCVSALYYEAGRLPDGTSMSPDEVRVRAGVMRHAAKIGQCDCTAVKP